MITIEKANILNLNYENLEKILSELKFKKYNTRQIFDWLHNKMEINFDNFSNISKDNRNILNSHFHIPNVKIKDHQISSEDDTEKLLFELEDSALIESVLIGHKERYTLCISSQIGCLLACDFCATAMMKYERYLDISEILLQFYSVQKYLNQKDKKIDNIVFMGMGEPFLNFDNVIEAIDILNSKDGQNYSKRNFTISTSGLVPYIKKFTELDSQINLAVSLHSVKNDLRNEIMPVNKKYPLEELKDSLLEYQKITKKRISFEYILIDKFNCEKEDAVDLINFLKDFSCLVNLIPYNPVLNKPYETPSRNKQYDFYRTLSKNNINVTLRDTKGQDIAAACGQLKAKRELI